MLSVQQIGYDTADAYVPEGIGVAKVEVHLSTVQPGDSSYACWAGRDRAI